MVKSPKICVFDKFLSTILGLSHSHLTQTEIQMDNFGPHTHGHTDGHTDTLLIFIHIEEQPAKKRLKCVGTEKAKDAC